MLVKVYGQPADSLEGGAHRRYSPAQCLGIKKNWVMGEPEDKHISTSYVERHPPRKCNWGRNMGKDHIFGATDIALYCDPSELSGSLVPWLQSIASIAAFRNWTNFITAAPPLGCWIVAVANLSAHIGGITELCARRIRQPLVLITSLTPTAKSHIAASGLRFDRVISLGMEPADIRAAVRVRA